MKCKKHGELEENLFYVQKGTNTERCKLCNREYAKGSKIRRKEQVNEWYKQDRKKYPEKYKKYAQDFKKRYPGRKSGVEIARRRGITHQEYLNMFDAQQNKCAVCEKGETRKMKDKVMKLTVDHCHLTNKVRGLLCHNYNTGIGKFFDSIEILESAINYLRRNNG